MNRLKKFVTLGLATATASVGLATVGPAPTAEATYQAPHIDDVTRTVYENESRNRGLVRTPKVWSNGKKIESVSTRFLLNGSHINTVSGSERGTWHVPQRTYRLDTTVRYREPITTYVPAVRDWVPSNTDAPCMATVPKLAEMRDVRIYDNSVSFTAAWQWNSTCKVRDEYNVPFSHIETTRHSFLRSVNREPGKFPTHVVARVESGEYTTRSLHPYVDPYRDSGWQFSWPDVSTGGSRPSNPPKMERYTIVQPSRTETSWSSVKTVRRSQNATVLATMDRREFRQVKMGMKRPQVRRIVGYAGTVESVHRVGKRTIRQLEFRTHTGGKAYVTLVGKKVRGKTWGW